MEKSTPAVISIGNFDGFHLGHQEIINKAKNIAFKKNLDLILITFDPNPKIFFKRIENLIFTDKQKSDLISLMNIDRVEYIDFKKIYKLTGFDFVKKYLIEKYSMKHLIVGENFKLGKGREWSIEKLEEIKNEWGFSVIVIPSIKLNGEKISSTKIREYLADGKLEKANMMLGREYYIEGKIISGEEIGRKLGFPTINMVENSTILPTGVFETHTEIGGELFRSITYIGSSPTLQNNTRVIETHIFDFNQDVYGEFAKIIFLKKIRNEIKFDSEIKLIEQIKKDILSTKVDKKLKF